MLEEITFPESLTEIQKNAFTGCQSLSSVMFLGNAPTVYRNEQYPTSNSFYGIAENAIAHVNPNAQGWPEDGVVWNDLIIQRFDPSILVPDEPDPDEPETPDEPYDPDNPSYPEVPDDPENPFADIDIRYPMPEMTSQYDELMNISTELPEYPTFDDNDIEGMGDEDTLSRFTHPWDGVPSCRLLT